ncbi:formylglycine-generating enzyme family protein [Stieleria varia]|nr:SUMF1/EgtB/PvdO family nonheme iron enzyme [Stieleria varia]
MFWSSAVDAYVSCLPITKIQFEYFLSDRPEPHFDEQWYRGVLERSPRVSPGKVRMNNYWHCFITGITPTDAQSFANWCGKNSDDTYELPSSEEWYSIYQSIKTEPTIAGSLYRELALKPRVESLLNQLELSAAKVQGGQRSMPDSLLMREGIFEWVRMKADQWGGAGLPHGEAGGGIINLDAGQPRQPTTIDPAPAFYGFRLLKR